MFRRRITVLKVVKAFQTLNARPARGTFANETGICGLQALERAFGYPAIVPLPLNVGFTWGWDAPWPLGVAFAVAAVAWLTLPDVPLFMIHRIGPRLLFWGLALLGASTNGGRRDALLPRSLHRSPFLRSGLGVALRERSRAGCSH